MTSATATIVALGDSTTAGTPGFLSPLEHPPDGSGNPESQYAYWLMHTHPEWRVLNRGVNGERSDQIRARFSRDVMRAGADLVVIVAGVNDIYQGRQPAAIVEDLEAMYELALENGLRVVAGSILPYNTATSSQNQRMCIVNAWIQRYARHRRRATWCDTRAAVTHPNDPDRLAASPDDLHPSPDGYRLMALALEPAIRTALLK